MWSAKADRKQLIDLIQTRDPSILALEKQNFFGAYQIVGDEVLLIWNDDPTLNSYLPEVICVSENKVQDFIAWASTYLKPFTPFTAFCRVLDLKSLNNLLPLSARQINKSFEGALIGAIIGETISLLESGEIKHQNILAAASTYSYAMSRAIILGITIDEYDVGVRYNKLRNLTNQHVLSSYSKSIEDIWKILIFIQKNERTTKVQNISALQNIVEACADIAKSGEISKTKWQGLTQTSFDKPLVDLKLDDNREIRVTQFEDLAPLLANQRIADSQTATFLCAYLANKIAPGTLKHLDLLKPYVSVFPCLYVWYGICAGLTPNTEIYTYKGGLGWRIARDLLQREQVFQRPRSDISLDELEILLGLQNPAISFNTESYTHLKVEVAPMVNINVTWPNKLRTDIKDKTDQQNLFQEISSEPNSKKFLSELGIALSNALTLYEKYTGKKSIPNESNYKQSYYKQNKTNKKNRKPE